MILKRSRIKTGYLLAQNGLRYDYLENYCAIGWSWPKVFALFDLFVVFRWRVHNLSYLRSSNKTMQDVPPKTDCYWLHSPRGEGLKLNPHLRLLAYCKKKNGLALSHQILDSYLSVFTLKVNFLSPGQGRSGDQIRSVEVAQVRLWPFPGPSLFEQWFWNSLCGVRTWVRSWCCES